MLENNISVESNQSPAAEPSNETQETNSLVSQLVGEGKKFKSIEALAYGKVKADEYIDSLLKEKQKLEEALTIYKVEKEILPMTTQNETTTQTNTTVQSTVEPTTKTADGSVDVEKLVVQLLAQQEAKKQAEENWNKVNKVLIQEFGDNAEKAVRDRAEALGLSVEDLKTMAYKSPESFFTLANIKPKEASFKSSYDSSQAYSRGSDSVAKTSEDAETLRKTDPAKYYSADYQKQRLQEFLRS